MGIQDHLTLLLRNLYTGQEATVRTGHRTMGWFKIGKEVCQSCILSTWLFKLRVVYIIWNAALDDSQVEVKIAGKKYQWPQTCRWNHFNGRKQRGAKEPLDEGERGEWKSWLKTQHSENWGHGIQSHHFMANRWGKRGNTVTFHFLRLQYHWEWWLQTQTYKMLAFLKKSYDKPKFSVTRSCPTLCDPMDCSTPGFPVPQNLLKFMSIELVMPFNHLIFYHPFLILPSIFPSIRVFSNESAFHIRSPKYWSFSFNISPS